ncbi:MAG: manganese transporter, partial [Bradyrhizobium sp.]
PSVPLGLLTNAVQTLAGVLLPSATVFLLLLCNDKAVLGPWTNNRGMNLFTGAVIAVLVMLSIILTASVIFPEGTNESVILSVLGAGTVIAVVIALTRGAIGGCSSRGTKQAHINAATRDGWRMPPIGELAPAEISRASRIWMGVLRGYLVIAGGLMLARIVQLAIAGHT